MPDDENIVRFDKPIQVIEFNDDYENSLGSTPPSPVAFDELPHLVQQAINEREDRSGFGAFRANALLLPDCHPSGFIYVAVNPAAKIACCFYTDRRLMSKIHPHLIDSTIGPVWIEPDETRDQGEEFDEVLAAKQFFKILNDIEGND
ncbi:hypothetical protein [Ensifer sp.]|uniref:hypothetical protein n=1 Tax=Ensifer sp. TaxID=1872086 RepID=UPI0028963F91|nr:hypothetical protein [Ensifer sp.]